MQQWQEQPPPCSASLSMNGNANRGRQPSSSLLLPVHNAAILVVWISLIAFGTFAGVQYVIPYLRHNATNPRLVELKWNSTDAGLYRREQESSSSSYQLSTIFNANHILLWHWAGGMVLMAAGPIQLLPWARRKWIHWHRWIGRLYLIAALLAGGGGLAFTLAYGTSRWDAHEDVGNVLFGAAMVVCAGGTYWYVAIDKRMALHQKWATRLFAVVMSAVLVRFLYAFYFVLVLYTPYAGNTVMYESLYYAFCIPVLMGLEVYWKWFADGDNTDKYRNDETINHNNNTEEENHYQASATEEGMPLLATQNTTENGSHDSPQPTPTSALTTTVAIKDRIKTILFRVGFYWWTVMTVILVVMVWVPAMLGMETQAGAVTTIGAEGTTG